MEKEKVLLSKQELCLGNYLYPGPEMERTTPCLLMGEQHESVAHAERGALLQSRCALLQAGEGC